MAYEVARRCLEAAPLNLDANAAICMLLRAFPGIAQRSRESRDRVKQEERDGVEAIIQREGTGAAGEAMPEEEQQRLGAAEARNLEAHARQASDLEALKREEPVDGIVRRVENEQKEHEKQGAHLRCLAVAHLRLLRLCPENPEAFDGRQSLAFSFSIVPALPSRGCISLSQTRPDNGFHPLGINPWKTPEDSEPQPLPQLFAEVHSCHTMPPSFLASSLLCRFPLPSCHAPIRLFVRRAGSQQLFPFSCPGLWQLHHHLTPSEALEAALLPADMLCVTETSMATAEVCAIWERLVSVLETLDADHLERCTVLHSLDTPSCSPSSGQWSTCDKQVGSLQRGGGGVHG